MTIKDDMENAFARMMDLHSRARRKAMGVDDALDEIINTLEGLNPPEIF